jgi:glycerol transport system ATP-binding protein
VTVDQAQDIGTYWLLTTRASDGTQIRARLHPHQPIPKAGDATWLQVIGPHTCFYANDLLIETAQGVAA